MAKQFSATWRNEGGRTVRERKVEYNVGPFRTFAATMTKIEKQFGEKLGDHDLLIQVTDRHAWVVIDPKGRKSQRATLKNLKPMPVKATRKAA